MCTFQKIIAKMSKILQGLGKGISKPKTKDNSTFRPTSGQTKGRLSLEPFTSTRRMRKGCETSLTSDAGRCKKLAIAKEIKVI